MEMRRDENEIRAILDNAASTCGRYVPEREISEAVRNSQVSAFQSLSVPHHPWPALNREQREAVVQETHSLVDLWGASAVQFDDNNPHTEEIIDAFFPGNPLLCCGNTQPTDFDTKPRSQWRE